MRRGNFEEENGRPIIKYRDYIKYRDFVQCNNSRTDQNAILDVALVGPRNHVLDGGSRSPHVNG